ncbi:Bax inhibitor-1/YccA family protein [Prevotella corporis]|uniref:Bax inhibitor-1/YccA family protein n=1 Tax=Prevotella corporis TaxID=28128 RepID=UPI0023F75133|nr:Bax inhibitor-1/YccA family protein [Prevotella corporis]
MKFNDYSRIADDRNRELELTRAFPMLMRKVYTWMTMALAITGIVAYGVSTSQSMMAMLYGGIAPLLIAVAVEFGIVIYLSARIQKLSLVAATSWFIIFSAINGLTMGWIFAAFTIASIAKTFFITAGTFGAMALIGFTTKKDMTKMGGILLMALIGLIIAGVVNMFLHSSMMDMIVSALGILIFTGLTAWDAQMIKRMLMQAPDAGESAQKIALLGSLNLYLDFINLFLYLLRFFGSSRE